jgi:hypothetical protein
MAVSMNLLEQVLRSLLAEGWVSREKLERRIGWVAS